MTVLQVGCESPEVLTHKLVSHKQPFILKTHTVLLRRECCCPADKHRGATLVIKGAALPQGVTTHKSLRSTLTERGVMGP